VAWLKTATMTTVLAVVVRVVGASVDDEDEISGERCEAATVGVLKSVMATVVGCCRRRQSKMSEIWM